jgi:hypothetical protein
VANTQKYEYKLLATSKTSTWRRTSGSRASRLPDDRHDVGRTLVGGSEVVSILRRPVP